ALAVKVGKPGRPPAPSSFVFGEAVCGASSPNNDRSRSEARATLPSPRPERLKNTRRDNIWRASIRGSMFFCLWLKRRQMGFQAHPCFYGSVDFSPHECGVG